MSSPARTDSVMPRQVRVAQLLLFGLAVTGLLVIAALEEGLTSFGLGEMVAPWFMIWVCALLALRYEGGARNGVRLTTVLVMLFVVFGAFSDVFGAVAPGEIVAAALRIVGGGPVIVLLFLPDATAWFDRAK
ncbi:hypothetical protein [Streptomyces acidicola]|uniref:hypothetical protein n=1 Tax=Streptomyces acidicola TaxID=2596892 RepID=UPI00380428BC